MEILQLNTGICLTWSKHSGLPFYNGTIIDWLFTKMFQHERHVYNTITGNKFS